MRIDINMTDNLTHLKELQDMTLEEILEYVNELELENSQMVDAITEYTGRLDELVIYSLAQRENANTIAYGVSALMAGDIEGADALTTGMDNELVLSASMPIDVITRLKQEEGNFHYGNDTIH